MTATMTKSKPFAWSYSRLKNFESCPRRHQQIDLLKNFEDKSEALYWGDRVHKAAAARLGSHKPLDPEFEPLLGPWIEKIEKAGGKIFVEQKLAITRDFKPCGYFDRGVWFRTVLDVIQICDDLAGVYDWKTGKILDDSVQLALGAQCVFSHYPRVKALKSVFIWLKEDTKTKENFSRADMVNLWATMKERVDVLEHAYNTETFPPNHNKLCRKHCVVNTCEYHGVSTWS